MSKIKRFTVSVTVILSLCVVVAILSYTNYPDIPTAQQANKLTAINTQETKVLKKRVAWVVKKKIWKAIEDKESSALVWASSFDLKRDATTLTRLQELVAAEVKGKGYRVNCKEYPGTYHSKTGCEIDWILSQEVNS